MELSDFFTTVQSSDKVFHFQLSGFWSDKIVDEIEKDFQEAFRLAVDSFGGNQFIVLADMADFKSPSAKAKDVMGLAMKYALDHGLYKAIEIIPSALARMGVDDAAKAHSSEDSFRVVVKSKLEGEEMAEKLKKDI